MNTYRYSLIRLTPNFEKGETINVGLVVYLNQGIDVRIINSESKLKAIDTNLDLHYLNDLTDSLIHLSELVEDVELLPKLFKGSLSLSSFGMFSVSSNETYDDKIKNLMDRLINPHKKKYKRVKRNIFFDIKEVFKKQGILGQSESDIFNHKVVTNFTISHDEGLVADFLLKNGKYHLTETIDFRAENIKKQMGEAAVSAITISKANEVYLNNIDSFVIYAAETIAQEQSARKQLNLLEKHCDNLINSYSKSDMDFYYDRMLNAAHDILSNQ